MIDVAAVVEHARLIVDALVLRLLHGSGHHFLIQVDELLCSILLLGALMVVAGALESFHAY